MSEHHLRIVSEIHAVDMEGKSLPRIATSAFYCGCRMWLTLYISRCEAWYAGETPKKSMSSILPVGDLSNATTAELVTMAEELLREKFGQFLGVDFGKGK